MEETESHRNDIDTWSVNGMVYDGDNWIAPGKYNGPGDRKEIPWRGRCAPGKALCGVCQGTGDMECEQWGRSDWATIKCSPIKACPLGMTTTSSSRQCKTCAPGTIASYPSSGEQVGASECKVRDPLSLRAF